MTENLPAYHASTDLLASLMDDLTTYRFVPQVPVSPTLARRILDLNAENQRNKKDRKVEVFARDMTQNRWREKTGQVVQIATDGTMLNGQNRMHAVDKSGKTIRFDICFGVDPLDMAVIDSHTPRSAADTIKVAGGGDISKVAPIVKHVIAYDMGYPKGPTGSTTASPLEILERYRSDADLFEAAAARGTDCARRNVGTPAAMGVGYYILARHQADKPQVDDFFDQLVSGIYPLSDPTRHAPYRLREKLIRYRLDRLDRPDILALVMRMWNRYNTLDAEGRRVPVDRVQAVRSENHEGLTNTNFPKPRRALKDAS